MLRTADSLAPRHGIDGYEAATRGLQIVESPHSFDLASSGQPNSLSSSR